MRPKEYHTPGRQRRRLECAQRSTTPQGGGEVRAHGVLLCESEAGDDKPSTLASRVDRLARAEEPMQSLHDCSSSEVILAPHTSSRVWPILYIVRIIEPTKSTPGPPNSPRCSVSCDEAGREKCTTHRASNKAGREAARNPHGRRRVYDTPSSSPSTCRTHNTAILAYVVAISKETRCRWW